MSMTIGNPGNSEIRSIDSQPITKEKPTNGIQTNDKAATNVADQDASTKNLNSTQGIQGNVRVQIPESMTKELQAAYKNLLAQSQSMNNVSGVKKFINNLVSFLNQTFDLSKLTESIKNGLQEITKQLKKVVENLKEVGLNKLQNLIEDNLIPFLKKARGGKLDVFINPLITLLQEKAVPTLENLINQGVQKGMELLDQGVQKGMNLLDQGAQKVQAKLAQL